MFTDFINLVEVINSDNAKNLHVPQYEGLNVENILKMGMENEQVCRHLPDERDIRRLPR